MRVAGLDVFVFELVEGEGTDETLSRTKSFQLLSEPMVSGTCFDT